MTTRTERLHGNDIVDSRDIIARIDELTASRDEATERLNELRANEFVRRGLPVDVIARPFHITRSRESSRVEYCEQLAEDLGAIR